MRALDEVLQELRAATESLLYDADRLVDADIAAPSLLPGWTRGHVVTHLAHNADAGVRLLGWARTGVPSFEYANLPARAAAIEQGALRPAAVQLEHLRAAAAAFQSACQAMSADHWRHRVTWTTGHETAADVVARARLAEVHIHHVDLAVGHQPAAWPPGFVSERLAGVVDALNRRHLVSESLRLNATDSGRAFALHGDVPPARTVTGAEVQLLTWLLGRSQGADLHVSDGRPLPVIPTTYSA